MLRNAYSILDMRDWQPSIIGCHNHSASLVFGLAEEFAFISSHMLWTPWVDYPVWTVVQSIRALSFSAKLAEVSGTSVTRAISSSSASIALTAISNVSTSSSFHFGRESRLGTSAPAGLHQRIILHPLPGTAISKKEIWSTQEIFFNLRARTILHDPKGWTCSTQGESSFIVWSFVDSNQGLELGRF